MYQKLKYVVIKPISYNGKKYSISVYFVINSDDVFDSEKNYTLSELIEIINRKDFSYVEYVYIDENGKSNIIDKMSSETIRPYAMNRDENSMLCLKNLLQLNAELALKDYLYDMLDKEEEKNIIVRLENLQKANGMEDVYQAMLYLRQGCKELVNPLLDCYLKDKGF